MIDLLAVKDFYSFYQDNKNFIDDKFKESCSDTKKLDIDEDLYQNAIDSGAVCLFSIEEEGLFIGYISLVISPDFLSKGKVTAIIDHFALDKDYRGKGIASHTLGRVEDFLKENNVNSLQICFPPTEEHNSIAEKLGYKQDTVFHLKEFGEKQW